MDKNKLKDVINFIADKQKFRPAIIEKDYHLTIILNAVNEYLSRDIIFKGGTLLNKAYLNYHRLSEDLDFSYRNDVDVSTRGKRSKAITSIRKKMPSFLPPTTVQVKHFYQDPFSGEDLFPQGSVLALSLEESAAEKLKAAISRLTPAIRDYYDLGHFIKIGFDFARPNLLKLVNKKLKLDGYKEDYSHNLGLSDQAIEELKRIRESDLIPMIRADEKFDLDVVLTHFNKLFN